MDDQRRSDESNIDLRFKAKKWIYNLMPRVKGANPRVYSDPHHRGPFLPLPQEWTLLDAVKAAVQLEQYRGK